LGPICLDTLNPINYYSSIVKTIYNLVSSYIYYVKLVSPMLSV